MDAIPERPSVLEIGKANWYGDVTGEEFHADTVKYGGQTFSTPPSSLWEIAERYYRCMLREPREFYALDLDPKAPRAYPFDLNTPWGGKAFDIVINTGTTEHVFSQGMVWDSINYACVPGGLMLHSLPLWGWLDHGFYNYHPTFVVDIAAANGYEILAWLYSELPPERYLVKVDSPADLYRLAPQRVGKSGMMHVAFRRTRDAAFVVPQQGYYRQPATLAAHRAWMERR